MKNERQKVSVISTALPRRPMARETVALLATSAILSLGMIAAAEEPSAKPEPKPGPEQWSIHFQSTVISQGHGEFPSPYAGPNSLPSREEIQTSFTSTLFLGGRLWPGAELYVNPELSGGKGIGGVLGVAGFPNGDIARVGKPEPSVSLARLFLRQTIGLGGDEESFNPDVNQLAGQVKVSRLRFTLGKFSATDLFDGNTYSHDPRTQFMNWAVMDNGAWDYPADTRGYSWGGTIELNQPTWALRYGLFAEPKVANGPTFDHQFSRAHAQSLEWERRFHWGERAGAVRVLGYWNRAHMGDYRRTLDNPAFNLDLTQTRSYSSKYGIGLSAEQELSTALGAFARLGWNDGHTESWAFTEIDRTASLGLSLKGTSWHRQDDVFGVAGVVNGLSKDHKDFLAAGGHGFIIGDGRLTYGAEEIAEAYYLLKVTRWLSATADYQFVEHPAYNRDRGPVHVWAIRAHVDF